MRPRSNAFQRAMALVMAVAILAASVLTIGHSYNLIA